MGVLGKMMGTLSGGKDIKISEQLLFDKVIGFRGIVEGVGCSTIVQNVAIALIDTTKYNVCVVDTHMLYPCQHKLLMNGEYKGKDIMDYSGDISEIIHETKYNNLYLACFNNRTILDMLSSKDSYTTVEKLFNDLKSYFDIILVDISHEPTNIAVHSCIKCNKIYNIIEPSIKCVSNIKKSLNHMVNLAVPFGKMRNAIINKDMKDVNSGILKTIEMFDLKLISRFNLSNEIAKYGITGKKVYASINKSEDVTEFHKNLKPIIEDMLQTNSSNQKNLKTADEKIPLPKEDMELPSEI